MVGFVVGLIRIYRGLEGLVSVVVGIMVAVSRKFSEKLVRVM